MPMRNEMRVRMLVPPVHIELGKRATRPSAQEYS
jgi:hypothetical protein